MFFLAKFSLHKKTFKVQEILDASQNMYLVPMVQCIKAFICPAFIGSAIFQQLRHLTTAAADGPNPSAADWFQGGTPTRSTSYM